MIQRPRIGLLLGVLSGLGCSSDPSSSAVTATGGLGSSSAGGAAGGSNASGAAGGGMTMPGPPGDPGCGLAAAAFCDTFDGPSSIRGRAGELDASKWSGARTQPQLPTAVGRVFAIGAATLPPCRGGLPSKVFPSGDALVCDPIDAILSNHLLVATAAQNYGQNSYRIRQPFDFGGRTGKIVFDAEGFNDSLLGWISVEVTEDPIGVPSYGVLDNDEGGVLPKNGFELQFSYDCNSVSPTFAFSPTALHVFRDYADQVIPLDWRSANPAPCVPAARGHLNHFEVRVSETNIEVYASAYSADGVTFEPASLLASADVVLGFARGYVHISAHNHATIKYSASGPCTTDQDCAALGPGFVCMDADQVRECRMDAWLSRWDNVGFDGPVLSQREVEVADSLVPQGNDAMNVGYVIAAESEGANETLSLPGVDLDGVVAAQLAVSVWYPREGVALDTYRLKYRLNAHDWIERSLSAGEISALSAPVLVGSSSPGGSQGVLGQMLDVPLSALVDGNNTLEFVTVNVPRNYPPAVLNIDLVLELE